MKKEGNSSFGFRNVWLTMVETCRAVGKYGRDCPSEETGPGNSNLVSQATKPLVVMKYYSERKRWQSGEGGGEKANKGDRCGHRVGRKTRVDGETQKPRGENRKNTRTEMSSLANLVTI